MANVVRDPREHPDAFIPDFSKPDPVLTFTKDDVAFVYGCRWKQRFFTRRGDDYFPLPAQWDIMHACWLPYHVPKNADWWAPLYPDDNMQLRPDRFATAATRSTTTSRQRASPNGTSAVRPVMDPAAIMSPVRCEQRSSIRRGSIMSPRFFLPRTLPDGGYNRFFIQRLKAGNRQQRSRIQGNAGHSCWRGAGIREFISHSHLTRLDFAVGSAGLMRQALPVGSAAFEPEITKGLCHVAEHCLAHAVGTSAVAGL
jgi:hypothetical protein